MQPFRVGTTLQLHCLVMASRPVLLAHERIELFQGNNTFSEGVNTLKPTTLSLFTIKGDTQVKCNRLALLWSIVSLVSVSLYAQTRGESPPANFKKVSTIVHLPDWLPGLGTLYVDPSSLPVGPYLGYNKDGQLVNVTYMIPLKDFEQHKNLNDLGQHVASMGLKVDHTSVEYNPGHPGLQEPHYHVIQWLISRAQQQREMQ